MRDVTSCYRNIPGTYQFLLTRPMRDVTLQFEKCRSSQAFLLTRPMRDVTTLRSADCTALPDFYSHVPCGT